MEFDDLWGKNSFELPEKSEDFCQYAQQFHEWAADLCTQAAEDPSVVFVNQAKVLLVNRYMDWYSSVPKAHQDHIGTRSSHTCIFQVFLRSYAKLRQLELSLTPPLLFEPPEAEPQPQPKPVRALVLEDLGEPRVK